MADGTRSQVTIRETEERIRTALEERMGTMEEQMVGIREMMQGFALQLTDLINQGAKK